MTGLKRLFLLPLGMKQIGPDAAVAFSARRSHGFVSSASVVSLSSTAEIACVEMLHILPDVIWSRTWYANFGAWLTCAAAARKILRKELGLSEFVSAQIA